MEDAGHKGKAGCKEKNRSWSVAQEWGDQWLDECWAEEEIGHDNQRECSEGGTVMQDGKEMIAERRELRGFDGEDGCCSMAEI